MRKRREFRLISQTSTFLTPNIFLSKPKTMLILGILKKLQFCKKILTVAFSIVQR
jgi:hypothetical protein